MFNDIAFLKERCNAFDIEIEIGPFESGCSPIGFNPYGISSTTMPTWVEISGKRFEYSENAAKYIDYLVHKKTKDEDDDDENGEGTDE